MNRPKISGVTFIKNGISLGYPILESIQSIDSLCDEIIINVGFDDVECTKDDGTFEYLQRNFQGKKYRFLKSFWDPELMTNGLILSNQTNIALREARGEYIQYIQGDECLHEHDLDQIRAGVAILDRRSELDGLVFGYHHFYGSTDVVKVTKKNYRQEVRLIRNHRGIKSWKDAQGFRHENDDKLKCIRVKANVYHYGWARIQNLMDAKNKSFNKLYHGQKHTEQDFSYQRIWGLKKFKGQHPACVREWIEKNRNEVDVFSLPLHISWRDYRSMASDCLEALTGVRIGEYKNFILKK